MNTMSNCLSRMLPENHEEMAVRTSTRIRLHLNLNSYEKLFCVIMFLVTLTSFIMIVMIWIEWSHPDTATSTSANNCNCSQTLLGNTTQRPYNGERICKAHNEETAYFLDWSENSTHVTVCKSAGAFIQSAYICKLATCSNKLKLSKVSLLNLKKAFIFLYTQTNYRKTGDFCSIVYPGIELCLGKSYDIKNLTITIDPVYSLNNREAVNFFDLLGYLTKY